MRGGRSTFAFASDANLASFISATAWSRDDMLAASYGLQLLRVKPWLCKDVVGSAHTHPIIRTPLQEIPRPSLKTISSAVLLQCEGTSPQTDCLNIPTADLQGFNVRQSPGAAGASAD